MGRKTQTKQSLLNRAIKEDDCLIFQGCKDKDGYGVSSIKGKKMPAHRAMAIFCFGQENVTGKYVLHKCHNTLCINPEHLYLGDQKQNIQDQIDRGTFVYGSKNGQALLDEASVKHIRSSSFGTKQLANYYGVTYSTIWDIRNYRSWKHVK